MAWTDNFGRPRGVLGNLLMTGMNIGHGPVSEWGMMHVHFRKDDTVLDVGCGGGRNLRRILNRVPEGKVCGIDISEDAVARSMKVNIDDIGKRVEVSLGSCDDIPYPDEMFDVVLSVESLYFWPDAMKAFIEIQRVMKHGAVFMIALEMSDPDTKWKKMVPDMNIYTEKDLVRMFVDSGFTDVKSSVGKKEQIVVTGKKA